MRNWIKTNEEINDSFIRAFHFKVNNSKLDNPLMLERQINKVIDRINRKYTVINNFYLKTGMVGDDFLYDSFRLIITVNCQK